MNSKIMYQNKISETGYCMEKRIKERIKKLIALIMAVVLFFQISGLQIFTVIAAEINIEGDITVDYTSEDNYIVSYVNATITLTKEGKIEGRIYGSGGEITIENQGYISDITHEGTVVLNNYATGRVNRMACVDAIVTNQGYIDTLQIYDGGIANLTGGQVRSLTGTYSGGTYPVIRATGNATVYSLTGKAEITGSGTINVVDVLSVENDINDVRLCVGKNTNVMVPAGVTATVYYNDYAYTITDYEGTLADGMGNVIFFTPEDENTVKLPQVTDFDVSKKYLKGESATIICEAADGYYFPEDYMPAADGKGTVSVKVTDAKKAEITYTFGNEEASEVKVTVPGATEQGVFDAPKGLAGKTGEVTGVTKEMEYASSPDALTWISCAPRNGSMALDGGVWYFRYKETVYKKAGPATEVRVKKMGQGSVSILDIYYGDEPYPVAASVTNSTKSVKFLYKCKGASDATYTSTVPTDIGSYTVRAEFEENEEYGMFYATADFSISYLPAPGKAYTLSGTKGNNGYYISNVTIIPPDGYWIAESLNGAYKNKLLIDENTYPDKIYLMNYSNGQKTEGINMESILIDTISPKIDLENGKIYYAQSLEVSVYDKALKEIYVNGEKQKGENSRILLKLLSDNGKKEYEIKAVDYAGNETIAKVTVAAEWIKSGIIPAGEKVNLETGNAYQLGDGSWKVAGDDTCYNGGQAIYVGTGGDYVFEKQ